MSKYRKKPVVIEARRLSETPNGVEQQRLIKWVRSAGNGSHASGHPLGISIPTLEGEMVASWGDYIIRGLQGEFYPCKPDIFEATYEAVEE